MPEQKTVLVVDDEEDAIAIVEAVLSDVGGVTTISAEDGDVGLQKAREAAPDLIVLDVQMPGKSGFDVFSELRGDPSTASIPVVMLTGIEEKTGLRFSGREMKAFLGKEPEAYVEKPVDPAALKKTVAELLA